MLVRNLTIEHIDKFEKFLKDRRFAPETVFQYSKDLRNFCRWLVKAGYIEEDLWQSKKISRPILPPSYLSDSEIQTLLEMVDGQSIEFPVRIGLNTGTRRSEILRLRWKNIDMAGKKIVIEGTKTNNAVRIVPLFPNFEEFLNKQDKENEFLFSNKSGTQLSAGALSTMLKRFKKKHPLAFDWDYQTLRKTYGATLLKKGCPIGTVSRLLGHGDIQITQKWYVRLTNEDVLNSIPKGIILDGF